MHRQSRIKSLSKGVRYYRDGLGLESVVPELIRLIAEPGFEHCVDDSRIFETLLEDPTLDPLIVAEQMWSENHPYVLSQLLCGSLETNEGTQNRAFTHTKPFRLMDLPGELRNRVYLHMLTPTVCLKDLTGRTSDWFNPAILSTSRQLNSEASHVIHDQQIIVLVDAMAMACHRNGSHKLPQKSRFARCKVDIDLSDPRLTIASEPKIHYTDSRKSVAEMVHMLVENLKGMTFLEELHLSCKRIKIVGRTYDVAGFFTDKDTPLFPDQTMDCFRKLKGLKKIVIEGDLGETYVAGLLKCMNKPAVDLTAAGPVIGIVSIVHCLTCSWPNENYMQVAGLSSPQNFRDTLVPGQMFDMHYPDVS